jgi:hypothetical protein
LWAEPSSDQSSLVESCGFSREQILEDCLKRIWQAIIQDIEVKRGKSDFENGPAKVIMSLSAKWKEILKSATKAAGVPELTFRSRQDYERE